MDMKSEQAEGGEGPGMNPVPTLGQDFLTLDS